MEDDIMKIEKDINYNKRQIEEIGSYIPFDIKLMERVENLIKELKKTKIENIEYKLGQTPDTTEDYKTLKKELEKWKNGEM